ncbi:adenosylmethionine--8-amino-7-oxononanoate transaminase [Pseudofulvibacter geojedonensis]|uniref:Adenosylmethionine-8-amino-7-oxononanoate aminotransferase n=1 Tax=Pseudofulvibacter geojedonensis TaxID=1123758 RepID=A0ABW3I4N6_9FLAO
MSLEQRDKKYIWHPLKQHQLNPDSLAIIKAKGCVLTDEDGNEYIDAISSWYTCMYGHCNDYITNRVSNQMKQLDQVMFSDFTHQPAVDLSEEMMKLLPDNQAKIFFSENGSTSTEVGIKMALQYFFNQERKRNVLVAFENAFHGDTFGAMSISGLSVYNGPFEDFLIDVKRIPVPNGDNNQEVLDQLKIILNEFPVAGFIYEPLIQGAAGMVMYDATGLNDILQLCKEHQVITIADEVMTGFGKTGKNFASDYLAIKPDVICMSKALTGGLMPMAITSCTQDIYDAFLSNDISKGLFHCHTYSANPLACTAALASVELLQTKEIQSAISVIVNSHNQFSKRIENHPKVKSTRSLGVVFALDLNTNSERYGGLRDKLLKFFMERGVFLRPLGNTIYIQPPYIITDKQLEKVYKTIEEALEIV